MNKYKKIFIVLFIMLTLNATGIKAQEQLFPSRALVIGTKEAPPFSMKTRNGTWTGISIDLWRKIADDLNLTFEFRELDLKGLLDGVANRSLDAAVAALTITPERERMLDFTHPFFTSGLGIAILSKGGNPWIAVLKRFMSLPFLKVVTMLVFVLLVVGLLVWWFERKKNSQQFGGGATQGISSGFWWSAVTMTTVGYGDKAPISLGGRIVALIWMFTAIIIISSFTAAITSSLTVTQLDSLVKGPKDLPKVSVGTILATTSEMYLRENRISFLSYKTPIEGLRALSGGHIDAFVYDAPILRYLVHQEFKGKLDVLPNRFHRQDYGIALPEGSPLRETINRVLLQKIREVAWQEMIYEYLGE